MVGEKGRLQVAYWRSVINGCVLKRSPELYEILLFMREMNDPVIVIQAERFTRNYVIIELCIS